MSRHTNTLNVFTFRNTITTSGVPEPLHAYGTISGTGIAFVAASATVENRPTITDSGNGFVTAGFLAGDYIRVQNTVSNNGFYHVDAAVAGTLFLRRGKDLVAETAGTRFYVSTVHGGDARAGGYPLPDGMTVTVRAMEANTGVINIGGSYTEALNTNSNSYRLPPNGTVSLQPRDLSLVWIDAAVSGEGVECIFEF